VTQTHPGSFAGHEQPASGAGAPQLLSPSGQKQSPASIPHTGPLSKGAPASQPQSWSPDAQAHPGGPASQLSTQVQLPATHCAEPATVDASATVDHFIRAAGGGRRIGADGLALPGAVDALLYDGAILSRGLATGTALADSAALGDWDPAIGLGRAR
jgi:hypothetical protein